jgi:hypothetical protein
MDDLERRFLDLCQRFLSSNKIETPIGVLSGKSKVSLPIPNRIIQEATAWTGHVKSPEARKAIEDDRFELVIEYLVPGLQVTICSLFNSPFQIFSWDYDNYDTRVYSDKALIALMTPRIEQHLALDLLAGI